MRKNGKQHTSDDLHDMIMELVQNSFEEIASGHGDTLQIILQADKTVSVQDNGRGVPVTPHPESGLPIVEHCLCGTGGNAADFGTGTIKGMGMSIVNSLSEWLEVQVDRQGRLYTQTYRLGEPVSELSDAGTTDKTGMRISFRPNPEFFRGCEVHLHELAAQVREAGKEINCAASIKDQRASRVCETWSMKRSGTQRG